MAVNILSQQNDLSRVHTDSKHYGYYYERGQACVLSSICSICSQYQTMISLASFNIYSPTNVGKVKNNIKNTNITGIPCEGKNRTQNPCGDLTRF